MMRITGFIIASAFFAASALAQQQPAPMASPMGPGTYSGTLQQEGGSGTTNVTFDVKHVTPDGRITARAQAKGARVMCRGNLPANGLVLKDGTMRFEVNDGVSEGCERIYLIKSASGGSLSGTYIDARKSGGKLIARTK